MIKRTFLDWQLVLIGTALCAALSTTPARADIDPKVAEAEAQRVAAVKKATVSTLAIFSPGGEGGGSGVVITADGYSLTNFHVAKPVGDSLKCGMSDGKL